MPPSPKRQGSADLSVLSRTRLKWLQPYEEGMIESHSRIAAMGEESTYLMIIGVGLIIGFAVWDIERRRAKQFHAQVERNRGLGLYKSQEFKKQSRQLLRLQRIAVLFLVVLGVMPIFIKLSSIASAIITLTGIVLWVVIITAYSKRRKLMLKGADSKGI